MQKTPYVFPIIGGRKIEHLHQNIEALEVALTPEHIKYLESILPFDKGFLSSFFVSEPLLLRIHRLTAYKGDDTGYGNHWKSAGHYDKWPLPEAIHPRAKDTKQSSA